MQESTLSIHIIIISNQYNHHLARTISPWLFIFSFFFSPKLFPFGFSLSMEHETSTCLHIIIIIFKCIRMWKMSTYIIYSIIINHIHYFFNVCAIINIFYNTHIKSLLKSFNNFLSKYLWIILHLVHFSQVFSVIISTMSQDVHLTWHFTSVLQWIISYNMNQSSLNN